jgi:ribosome-associated translation inhibitor RaiA
MMRPLRITFRGIPHSEALEADIQECVQGLETFYDRIIGCDVLVELPHRHRHDGRHFHVRIALTVPGGADIIISREPSLHGTTKALTEEEHHKSTETASVYQYAHVAVHEAFRTARRRLQDFVRQQRGDIKTHETPAPG